MQKFPLILLALYLLIFIILGIAPAQREVWVAEVLPAIGVIALLLICYRNFRLSNTSYLLMFFWLVWHTIGAHFTFERVPFEWFSELIGSDRNHFDRLGHFMVGFYAFPIAEWIVRRKHAGIHLAGAFGLFFVMAVAAFYEIIEWQYAEIAGGQNASDFLGSQGDIWDAQKDMLCDTLGAVFSLILFYLIRPDKRIPAEN